MKPNLFLQPRMLGQLLTELTERYPELITQLVQQLNDGKSSQSPYSPLDLETRPTVDTASTEATNTGFEAATPQQGSKQRIDCAQWITELHGPSQPQYLLLEQINRPNLTTAEAAVVLNRRPQTLRGWSSLENGPLRPLRINGRLAWPVRELKRVLGVA